MIRLFPKGYNAVGETGVRHPCCKKLDGTANGDQTGLALAKTTHPDTGAADEHGTRLERPSAAQRPIAT